MINHSLTVILAEMIVTTSIRNKSILEKLGEIEPQTRLVYLVAFLTIHLFISACLQHIARKFELENDWLAWIPVLQCILLAKAAGESSFLTWCFLIPIVNIGLFTLLMLKVSNRLGIWYKPDYLIFTISIAATIIPFLVNPLFLLGIPLYLGVMAFK